MKPGKKYSDSEIIIRLGDVNIPVVGLRWTRAQSTNNPDILNEYLKDALENEDYEEAADLRDAINKLDNSRVRF